MIYIVNYRSGNINAIADIYKTLNMAVSIANEPEEIGVAEKIILRGMRVFDQVIKCLNESGIRAVINELVVERKILS
jgi:glutamine amidotransferase